MAVAGDHPRQRELRADDIDPAVRAQAHRARQAADPGRCRQRAPVEVDGLCTHRHGLQVECGAAGHCCRGACACGAAQAAGVGNSQLALADRGGAAVAVGPAQRERAGARFAQAGVAAQLRRQRQVGGAAHGQRRSAQGSAAAGDAAAGVSHRASGLVEIADVEHAGADLQRAAAQRRCAGHQQLAAAQRDRAAVVGLVAAAQRQAGAASLAQGAAAADGAAQRLVDAGAVHQAGPVGQGHRACIGAAAQSAGATDLQRALAHRGVAGVGAEARQAQRARAVLMQRTAAADDAAMAVAVRSIEAQRGVVEHVANPAGRAAIAHLQHARTDSGAAAVAVVSGQDQEAASVAVFDQAASAADHASQRLVGARTVAQAGAGGQRHRAGEAARTQLPGAAQLHRAGVHRDGAAVAADAGQRQRARGGAVFDHGAGAADHAAQRLVNAGADPQRGAVGNRDRAAVVPRAQAGRSLQYQAAVVDRGGAAVGVGSAQRERAGARLAQACAAAQLCRQRQVGGAAHGQRRSAQGSAAAGDAAAGVSHRASGLVEIADVEHAGADLQRAAAQRRCAGHQQLAAAQRDRAAVVGLVAAAQRQAGAASLAQGAAAADGAAQRLVDAGAVHQAGPVGQGHRACIGAAAQSAGATDLQRALAHRGVAGVGAEARQAQRARAVLMQRTAAADDAAMAVAVRSIEAQRGVVEHVANPAGRAAIAHLQHARTDSGAAAVAVVSGQDQEAASVAVFDQAASAADHASQRLVGARTVAQAGAGGQRHRAGEAARTQLPGAAQLHRAGVHRDGAAVAADAGQRQRARGGAVFDHGAGAADHAAQRLVNAGADPQRGAVGNRDRAAVASSAQAGRSLQHQAAAADGGGATVAAAAGQGQRAGAGFGQAGASTRDRA